MCTFGPFGPGSPGCRWRNGLPGVRSPLGICSDSVLRIVPHRRGPDTVRGRRCCPVDLSLPGRHIASGKSEHHSLFEAVLEMARTREQLVRDAAARGKYAPLYRHLVSIPVRQEWRSTFGEVEAIVPRLRRHRTFRATAHFRANPRWHRPGAKTRASTGPSAARPGADFGRAETHRSRLVARTSAKTARHWQGNGLQGRRHDARRSFFALSVILRTNLPMIPIRVVLAYWVSFVRSQDCIWLFPGCHSQRLPLPLKMDTFVAA